MRVYLSIITIILSLASCGGGNIGQQGTPGKSAYEIWLEQGNVGTEQDFLDSLVSGNIPDNTDKDDEPAPESQPWRDDGNWDRDFMVRYTNAEDYLSNNSHDKLTKNTINWPGHADYNQYEMQYYDAANKLEYKYVYSEKELNLANYGIVATTSRSYYNTVNTYIGAYYHNREGENANIYTPATGATFNGGTMAYLYYDGDKEMVKGDASFKYDPTNPQLRLFFDNYYTFKISRETDGDYTTIITGENQTGKDHFDLSPGVFKNDYVAISAGYLKKDGIEEAVGTYEATFGMLGADGSTTNTYPHTFTITGAFGGTKQ